MIEGYQMIFQILKLSAILMQIMWKSRPYHQLSEVVFGKAIRIADGSILENTFYILHYYFQMEFMNIQLKRQLRLSKLEDVAASMYK